MKNSTFGKTLFFIWVFTFFSLFYVQGQFVDQLIPGVQESNFSDQERLRTLDKAPAIQLNMARQKIQASTNIRSLSSSSSLSSFINENPNSTRLGGYAISLISSTTCASVPAYNVFGFFTDEVCNRIVYPSPFTTAGFSDLGVVLRVYSGTWTGSEWQVFTTLRSSGVDYLGYWMTFDPVSRETKVIGEAVPEMQCLDMAYDPIGDKIYGVNVDKKLILMDRATTGTQVVGEIRRNNEPFNGRFMAMACNSEGVLYAINVDGNLYTVDKSTAAATLVGSLELGRTVLSEWQQSATFDLRSNTLYFACPGTAYHELYSISTETGKATRMDNIYTQITGLFHHYYTSEDVPADNISEFRINNEENPMAVKISWKNPDKDYNGNSLTNLDKIRIYRGVDSNSMQLYETLTPTGLGMEQTFEITEIEAGVYYYGCMPVTTSGKEGLLIGGAAYCLNASIPYTTSFEEEDNNIPIVLGSAWTYEEDATKARTGFYSARTAALNNKLEIQGLRADKGAVYRLDLWARFNATNRRVVVDFGEKTNQATSISSSNTYTQVTQTGYAPGDILPVAIYVTGSSGTLNIDDISISRVYPNTTPDSVTSLKIKIPEGEEMSAEVSWVNPEFDAGGNPLVNLEGVVIERATNTTYTANLAIDTIRNVEIGEISSTTVAVPTPGIYYFRVSTLNEDGPSPYPYTFGRVGYIGRDSIPIAPQNMALELMEEGKVRVTWDPVTIGKNGGYLNGTITGYEVVCATHNHTSVYNNSFVVTGTEFVSESLPLGVFSFKVRAICDNGQVSAQTTRYTTAGVKDNRVIVTNNDITATSITQNTNPLAVTNGGTVYGGYYTVTQTIFWEEEMPGACVIDSLFFFLSTPIQDLTQRRQIYLGYRDENVFDNSYSDWSSIRDSRTELVFDDDIEFYNEYQIVKIPIKPFYYDGTTNLVLTVIKEDNDNPPSSYTLLGYNWNNIRNLYLNDRTGIIVGLEDVSAEYLGNGMINYITPNMVVSRITELGSVKGVIRNKMTGEFLENVKVTITPYEGERMEMSISFTNDPESGEFEFTYLPKGKYKMIVSKTDFKEIMEEIEITPGTSLEYTFEMEYANLVSVEGKVVDARGTGIQDVKIVLSGAIDNEVVSDENGAFIFERVFSDNTYRINFSKEDYQSREITWEVGEIDSTYADVLLSYTPYEVSHVEASATRSQAAINFGNPSSKSIATWAQQDQIYRALGGGRERMIGAIQFYPSDYVTNDLVDKDLVGVNFYAYDPTANYQIHVYVNENMEVPVYTQEVGCKEAGWQYVHFDVPFEFDKEIPIAIGLEATPGYRGSPLPVDAGPKNINGELFYFDGEWTTLSRRVSGYEYNWLIKGVFGRNPGQNLPRGYSLYRLIDGDEKEESKWELITDDLAETDSEYMDDSWANVSDTTYLYAIKADWLTNNSEAVFSNKIYKGIDAEITVEINTNGVSPEGTFVTLENMNRSPLFSYSQVAAVDGLVEFKNVRKGYYSIRAELEGHEMIQADSVIVYTDMTMKTPLLKEIITDPSILKIEKVDEKVVLHWSLNHPKNWSDDFESYNDFAIEGYGDYILSSPVLKYGMNNISWLNSTASQSFIVFNPSATTPALESFVYLPYSGNKYLASFLASSNRTNDYLVREVGGGGRLSFMARGVSNRENFRVMYSSTDDSESSFILLGDTIIATNDWVKYSFELPEAAKYVAINNIISNVTALLVDDMEYVVQPIGIPVSYEVYLNNELRQGGIKVEDTSYTFENLTNGKHVFGLKAIFNTGESKLITIEFDPDGLYAEKIADLQVYGKDNGIVIEGADNKMIEVISTDGRILINLIAEDFTYIPIEKGIYFVRIDNQLTKVFVK